MANLEFRHIQQREGRWVNVDLVGKGNKVRTVPIPSWVKVAIDEWAKAVGLSTGRVFRGVFHYGNKLLPNSDGITTQAIYYAVQDAIYQIGFCDISPHDLRRTFAKLAHKGGADLGQIQFTLGHASLKTTERYLGIE